jgi:hypothetical protein
VPLLLIRAHSSDRLGVHRARLPPRRARFCSKCTSRCRVPCTRPRQRSSPQPRARSSFPCTQASVAEFRRQTRAPDETRASRVHRGRFRFRLPRELTGVRAKTAVSHAIRAPRRRRPHAPTRCSSRLLGAAQRRRCDAALPTPVRRSRLCLDAVVSAGIACACRPRMRNLIQAAGPLREAV